MGDRGSRRKLVYRLIQYRTLARTKPDSLGPSPTADLCSQRCRSNGYVGRFESCSESSYSILHSLGRVLRKPRHEGDEAQVVMVPSISLFLSIPLWTAINMIPRLEV